MVATKLTVLRNAKTDSKSFRELVREIAALLAYEATLDLAVQEVEVQTPLAIARGTRLLERVGLVPVLRAGLGMVEGVWELMPGVRGLAYWLVSRRKNAQTGGVLQQAANRADSVGLSGAGSDARHWRFCRRYGGYP